MTARPVICNDLADPTRTVYGREDLLAQGLRAFSAWPLSVDGTVVGALDLGSSEPNAFDEEELSLLRQVAASLSFALQYIEKEDAAEYLAYFDPMTGLARRELFCERIARTLSSPEPHDARELVVLVLDVERLGAINDRYGRHAGDLVTQLVAERLKSSIADPTRSRSLNMVAIAEGVETEGELRELLRLGCQQFQGFIAAKPMPADEFRSLIAASGGAIMPPLAVTDRSTDMRARRAAKKAKVESESRLAPSDAIARERERLAYELHDGVCQQLAGISFLLGPLIGPLVQLDPGVARELEHIATLLREAIQTARTLAHDRAGGTERESSDLQGALQVHAARLQAAHGVTIKVDATALSSRPLSRIAVSELAKLAREAMRNAIRHGRARSIIVRLKEAGHHWQLEISDDGVGLSGDFARRGGLGLRSMRHRAARLQGTFEIVRLAPRGTCLRVSWPKHSEN